MAQNSRRHSIYLIAVTWLSLYWIVFISLEIGGAIVPTASIRAVEVGIIIFFIVDYVRQFIAARDKKRYFKENIFALLSIFPPLAILRVVTLAHTDGYWHRFLRGGRELLRTNGFGAIMLSTCMTIFFATIALYHIEYGKSVSNYFQAFYNVITTIATIGYGDFAPQTFAGRCVVIFLSVFSIAIIGIITGTLANFFFSRLGSEEDRAEKRSDLELSGLTKKQKQDILDYVRYVRYRSANEPEGIPSPGEEHGTSSADTYAEQSDG